MISPLLYARASWIITTAAVVAELEDRHGQGSEQLGEALLKRATELWSQDHGMAELEAAVIELDRIAFKKPAPPDAANDE